MHAVQGIKKIQAQRVSSLCGKTGTSLPCCSLTCRLKLCQGKMEQAEHWGPYRQHGNWHNSLWGTQLQLANSVQILPKSLSFLFANVYIHHLLFYSHANSQVKQVFKTILCSSLQEVMDFIPEVPFLDNALMKFHIINGQHGMASPFQYERSVTMPTICQNHQTNKITYYWTITSHGLVWYRIYINKVILFPKIKT